MKCFYKRAKCKHFKKHSALTKSAVDKAIKRADERKHAAVKALCELRLKAGLDMTLQMDVEDE